MARNLGLEIAQILPVVRLIQINFRKGYRAPRAGLGQRHAVVTINGRDHPVLRDIGVGAADNIDMPGIGSAQSA